MIELFESYFSFSSFEYIVLGSVILTFAIQIYYYTNVFGRLAFTSKKKPLSSDPLPPVSVIICARNEYVALQKHLKLVLDQDYPEFEVIVVNDCSEDDSEILLASMQIQYPHLNFRTIVKDEIYAHGKKMALGVGIKAARHDFLLFIDADCYPASPQWLRQMQSRFTEKTDIVLGYTRLVNNRAWIRADRLMQAFHYLGKALKHKPYMGIGSNLAYRKNLFFNNKGFDMRITENLREDRIFINKVATSTNTAVALSPEAVTISTLRISAKRWRRERHEELRSFALCRSNRYPQLSEVLWRLLFFAGMAMAIVQNVDNVSREPILFSLLGLIIIRFSLQLTVFIKAKKRLGEKGLIFMLFLWDLIFPFIYLSLIFSSHMPHRKRR